ncbi:MAG: hypothetical protein EXX96DRAFT_572676 [Benjaminiella poitrasii]|nr:MAG: hypothetical protein EXX96DRAFT_572676 [Benjaminiella poitrasii]
MNRDRTIAGLDVMERKITGRKVDFIFYRQLLEYGCCECGRNDDQTKKLKDGIFKMARVLKDMLYSLYKKSPESLCGLTLVGFLLFETKFTMVLYDAPAGYICRISHTKTTDLPEEADDICNELLPILEAVYRARLTMESTNKIIKQKAQYVDLDLEQYSEMFPSFNSVL